MYYPQEVVDEVLANTDIVDVISAHVHLKKRGNTYVGLCPFHNEKTPSFNVNPDRQFYYCFGCGTGGSAITFLMKYNNSTFREALQDLADRAQITLPAPNYSEETKKREKHRQDLLAINKEAATYYYRLLRSRKGERGMRYFKDRELKPETMKMFGLGFADGARSDLTEYLRKAGFSDELILESDVAVFNEKQGLHDRFFNRVMFPIQDERGRVIGFGGRVLGDAKPKYINSSDTQIFDKGRNLYALNLARRSKAGHLILCEGYMDVIAMHQAGFNQAVASLGTAFTPGQAALLKRYTGRVLLAYDSDEAGVRAALRNIGILRSGGLDSAVIDLQPFKDPDEFIKSEGREAFQARIDSAENSFFFELRILSQSYRMDDPASRTAFHREVARKLCTFTDEIERENYIAASAEKYFIKTDSLRRLVAQYGNATGYGAGAQDARRTRTNVYGRRENLQMNGKGRGVPQGSSPADTGRTGYTNGTDRGGGQGDPRAGDRRTDRAASQGNTPADTGRTGHTNRTGHTQWTGTQENTPAGGDGRTGHTNRTGHTQWTGTQENAPAGGAGRTGQTDRGTGQEEITRRTNSAGAVRARKALREKQSLLLSWIVDEPAAFSQIRKYLRPKDFDGTLFTETARLLWDQMEAREAKPNAASVISSFETTQEQETVTAILNMHLEGIKDKKDKTRALRELVYFIRKASLDRQTQSGGAGSLQELLASKQELQSLQTADFSY